MSSIRFDVITIFPKVVEAYFNESILKRAQKKKLIEIKVWNLRDFAEVAPRQARDNFSPRRKIDDRPFGGGPGMVIKIEPLVKCLEKILGRKVTPLNPPYSKGDKKKHAPLKVWGREARGVMVVFLSASGKQFNSKMAAGFAKKHDRIILIAGHYEGIDERIKKLIHDSGFKIHELSVGPYVLTGGELPAMAIVDAVSRHIHGVLGKAESLEEKRYGIGVPVYTRPEVFSARGGSALGRKGKKYVVPKVLLSGDHKKIDAWRARHKSV